MSADHPNRDSAEIVLPVLSDDAVVEIHGFIEEVLALFESRYADQIRRFYDGLREDNIITGRDHHDIDDPPF